MAFIRYFIAVPRIILNDQTCSQTDKLVYGMINSLSNNNDYCYASNNCFANIICVKEKTISNSINNLKRKKYINVKFVKGRRRIYLNPDIVYQENSKVLEKKEDTYLVKNYQHKRKEYTRKNNNINKISPYWLEHPEICVDEPASKEDIKELEELLSKYKED